jgi:hypothetical protein
VFVMLDGLEFEDTGADHAEVIWLRTPRGVQAVVWPMRLRSRETHRA